MIMKRFLGLTLPLLPFCLALAPVQGFAQDKFFDSNGVKIRYVDGGAGEPVVLIHGNGSTLESWVNSGVLPNLAKDYRVIALDARGHGKSGKPHDVKAYGPEMGLDVVRLLDHLAVQRAHIVGYSMGAHITAQLLTTHPERFLTATLGGAAGRFTWGKEELERSEQEAREREKECVSRSQIMRLAPTNGPKPTEDEIKRRSAACMADPNQDRFAQAALTRGQKDQMITPAQVAAVRVPTLGVVGTLDDYLRDFQELKKLRPDVKLVIVESATHGGDRGAGRRPEFIAAVRELLASARSRSSR